MTEPYRGERAVDFLARAEWLEAEAERRPEDSLRLLHKARQWREHAKAAVGGEQDEPVGGRAFDGAAAQPRGPVYGR